MTEQLSLVEMQMRLMVMQQFNVNYISGDENVADVFTKPLSADKFYKHIEKLVKEV